MRNRYKTATMSMAVWVALLATNALMVSHDTCATDARQQYKWDHFETTITVRYNSLTLTEAAAKESAFRKQFGAEACQISVGLKKVLTPSAVIDTSYIWTPPVGTIRVEDGTWHQDYILTH